MNFVGVLSINTRAIGARLLANKNIMGRIFCGGGHLGGGAPRICGEATCPQAPVATPLYSFKRLFICDIIPFFLHISNHSAFSFSQFVSSFWFLLISFLFLRLLFVSLFLLKHAAIVIERHPTCIEPGGTYAHSPSPEPLAVSGKG